MKKDDFIFTIGYQGGTALVDRPSKTKFGNLDTQQLLEKGLFRFAFCSALYDNDEKMMTDVMNVYNEKSNASYSTLLEVKRLFGVYKVPDDILKILYI